jgi:hypothetical protein
MATVCYNNPCSEMDNRRLSGRANEALLRAPLLAEVRDAAGHCNVSITSGYLHVAVDDETAVGSLFSARHAKWSACSPRSLLPCPMLTAYHEAAVALIPLFAALRIRARDNQTGIDGVGDRLQR